MAVYFVLVKGGKKMITIDLVLSGGKKVPCKIKDRHYKKILVVLGEVAGLSFWEKLSVLFSRTKRKKVK